MNWISVKDKMPEHGVPVLATYTNYYGKSRRIIAEYIHRWKEESNFEAETNDEYNEELDMYFLKEGWYEKIDNWGDFSSVFVHEGEVKYWMPLPKSPLEGGQP